MLKEGQIRVSNRMFCSSYGSCLVVCYGIESGESRKTNKCIFTHFKAFCYVKQLSVMDKKRDVRVCFRLMWLLPQLSFTTAAADLVLWIGWGAVSCTTSTCNNNSFVMKRRRKREKSIPFVAASCVIITGKTTLLTAIWLSCWIHFQSSL